MGGSSSLYPAEFYPQQRIKNIPLDFNEIFSHKNTVPWKFSIGPLWIDFWISPEKRNTLCLFSSETLAQLSSII